VTAAAVVVAVVAVAALALVLPLVVALAVAVAVVLAWDLSGRRTSARQGLTLVHFSDHPEPFWSHLPVSLCLIDWGTIMQSTYPTKCAYVAPRSGRV